MDNQYSRYRSYSQQANPFHDQPEGPNGGNYPTSPQQSAPTLYGGAQAPSAAGAAITRVMQPPAATPRQPPMPAHLAAPVGAPRMPMVQPTPQTPASPMPMQTPAAQRGLGAFANRLEGFDHGKLANAGHDTAKYQFGRVFSQFDPTQGITQELLDRLNALGLAQVSGKVGGDKLSISNATHPSFEGFAGELDVLRDLGKGGWQWSTASKTAGAPRPGGMSGGVPPDAMGMLMGSNRGPTVPVGMGGNYSDQILKYLMQQLAINKTLGV